MGFFEALVAVSAIGAFVWLRTQRHRGDKINAEANSELAEEVRRLRERVTVLERIATEKRDDVELAREIERLRD